MSSSGASVRRAGLGDAEALVDLHHVCWQEAYADLMPPERIAEVFADRAALVKRRRAQLVDPVAAVWVAEEPGLARMVGFASSGPARRTDAPTELELYAVYTRAAVWGRGVGAALLEAAIPPGRPAHLWALAGNARALAFYAKHGLTPDGATDDQPLGRHLRLSRLG